jgi:hypothetical protein
LVVFNVYEPPEATGDRIDRAERLIFIRDGFHWWAALIPALWLLVKGLWLELIAFLVLAGALAWSLEAAGMTPAAASMVFVIVQIVIGFEASQIYAAALKRRGWREAGTVTGRNQDECERRFLATWLPQQPDNAPASPEDGAPPPGGGAQPWTNVALDRARQAIAQGRELVGGRKLEAKA